MFGVKMESAAVCRGCLSTDRKLSYLTSNKLYLNLLTDKQKQEALMQSVIFMCWECTAALERMQLFQTQAQQAHMVLKESLENTVSLRSLSTLSTCHKHLYDAIFHEIENEEIPSEEEKSSVESGDDSNIEDCNYIGDSDHLEVYAELSSEEKTMTDELKVTSTSSTNKQLVEKIENKIPVINTKIKVKTLLENEYNVTRQTIVKRPASSRIKKPVLNKFMAEDWLKKKKILKKATSAVQFRQGIRRSKRISGIVEVEERENSIECYVDNSDYVETNNVELTKENNAYDCDIVLRDDVDLSILNKDSVENEEVNTNKIDLIRTENVNDSCNGGKDNVHKNSKNGKSESIEAALGGVLEQSEENEEHESNEVHLENAEDSGHSGRDNFHTDSKDVERESVEAAKGTPKPTGLELSEESEEDESNEVHSDDFRKTKVEYYYDELEIYFTKVEMSEDETKAALEKEPTYVTKELPYNCVYCGICFQLKKTMYGHEKHRHKQLKMALKQHNPYMYYRNRMCRCKQCSTVLREDLTEAHMKYAHRIRYFCKHCDMDFWNKEDCKQHLLANHSRFDCDLCPETRPTFRLLEYHKRRDHKVRKPRFKDNVQCEECGKAIRSKSHLIAHQEKWHPREGTDPRFHCAPCKLTLRSEKHYRWHLKYAKAHNPPTTRQRVACPVCGKLYKKYDLKRHYDRSHGDKTDFPCETCGKYFARKSGLVYHLNRVHLNIPLPKNKLCIICGRGFASNRILENHIRTHTGERPFACALCPAAFAQPWPLKKHTATQHPQRTHRQREIQSQSFDEVLVESRNLDGEITGSKSEEKIIGS